MSTVNPLFLDSTKPIGDKVVTDVELTCVLLRDGDSLFLEVKDSHGALQKFELREIITKKSVKYKAEIWLKQREQFQYRFTLESMGHRIFASSFRNRIAGEMILEKWEPELQSEPLKVSAGRSLPNKADTTQKKKQPKDVKEVKSKSSKDPLDPQIFNQFKSLLDDLL